VALVMVRAGEAVPGDADLVILPGSKATLADLAFLRQQGWDIDLIAHRRRGGTILGLCGGYQMLGRRVADPEGREGPSAEAEGLGLLELDTVLAGDKRLAAVEGKDARDGLAVRGYEMHLGRTAGPAAARPMLLLASGPEGAVSADGRVMGCYLHGLFATDAYRHAFLSRLRDRRPSGLAYDAEVEATLDRLAEHLAAHLDLDGLLDAAMRGQSKEPAAPRRAIHRGRSG
jgi:adenosylcobyric acid synthase